MKIRHCGVAAVLSVMLTGTVSVADDFHYTNILIGDRASGMGGAYTAVSDDPSGMYYNPAGITYTSGRDLSASVNAYHSVYKKFDGVIGGNGWTRTSSALLPNYFGVVQPIGKLKVGFSYAVPDSILEDQDQTFTAQANGSPLTSSIPGVTVNRYVINLNNNDSTNQFGPSVAAEVGDHLSVGMTLYAHRRSTEFIFNQLVQLSDGRDQWTNQYMETNEWGVRPILGVMWAPMDKFSFGVAASRTFVLSSDNTNQLTQKDVEPNPATRLPIARTELSTGEKRKYPYHFTVGGAWFPSKEFLLALDINYFTGVDYTLLGQTVKKDDVVNFALGTEYYLNPNWALRGGVYTNFANTPGITSASPIMSEKIDVYGGSLTLSHFTRNTSITGGGSFSYGTGQALVKAAPEPQDASYKSWSIFVSSSYAY